MKTFITVLLLAVLAALAGLFVWARTPLLPTEAATVEVTIRPGSSVRSTAEQIAEAGVPAPPLLLEALARLSGKSSRLKAGSYEVEGGTTPLRLLDQLARGEFAQHALVVIEGWTFEQMRRAINDNKALRHDTAQWTEAQIMAAVAPQFKHAEGLFFPDTYRFAKGTSDLLVLKQAHALMIKRLNEAWAARAENLPYAAPYEALIMASIVEKETGAKAERDQIAAVFVNRLRTGMLLQTDPTVIYGMGAKFDGNLRKRDLQTDTPWNTYTRAGLPPTPISLPGAASIAAALHPAQSKALYFVAKGDGSSHFSSTLDEHNRAVNRYQRAGAAVQPANPKNQESKR